MIPSAVVLSNWAYDNNNVPERLARGLAMQGFSVYYLPNPYAKSLSKNQTRFHAVNDRISIHEHKIRGARFGDCILARWQWHRVLRRLTTQAKASGDQIQYIFYHDAWALNAISALAKFRDHFVPRVKLVHLNIDVTDHPKNSHLADRIAVIPTLTREKMAQTHGRKVIFCDQFASDDTADRHTVSNFHGTGAGEGERQIKRIVYLGRPEGRVDWNVVTQVAAAMPDCEFLFNGPVSSLQSNVRDLGWLDRGELAALLHNTDVGFAPYSINRLMEYGCVPLKYFDYFSYGIPVVTSPIHYARTLGDLVYVAEDAQQIQAAIRKALSEPVNHSARAQRRQMALRHLSSTVVARLLHSCSGDDGD